MKNNSISEKIAKSIRIITISPIMALVMLTVLYFQVPEKTGGLVPYLCAVLFISIFPVLAYPLQPLIPYYRDKGRTGQRNLAIIMSVLGYLLGIIFALIYKQTKLLLIIYITYLLSGIAIALFSKKTKIKASGHACGLAGPLNILIYVFGVKALWGLILIPLLFWSSIKTKRHTFTELIIGSIIPVVIFYLLLFIIK